MRQTEHETFAPWEAEDTGESTETAPRRAPRSGRGDILPVGVERGMVRALRNPAFTLAGAPEDCVPVGLVPLGPDRCHWPLGETPLFCGLPVTLNKAGRRSSWCAHHHPIVHPQSDQ